MVSSLQESILPPGSCGLIVWQFGKLSIQTVIEMLTLLLKIIDIQYVLIYLHIHILLCVSVCGVCQRERGQKQLEGKHITGTHAKKQIIPRIAHTQRKFALKPWHTHTHTESAPTHWHGMYHIYCLL